MTRYRVKPSKPASALGVVVGVVMVGLGLFVAIPTFGAFGIFWTLVAAAITVFNAINVFTDAGLAGTEIIEDAGPPGAKPLQFDERLRRLEHLREEGLVTDDEYQRKRAELLDERW
jgi:hypothetical protein